MVEAVGIKNKLFALFFVALLPICVAAGTTTWTNIPSSLHTSSTRRQAASLRVTEIRGGARNNDNNKNKSRNKNPRTHTGSFSSTTTTSGGRRNNKNMNRRSRDTTFNNKPETNKYVTEDTGSSIQYQRKRQSTTSTTTNNGGGFNWNKFKTQDLSKTVSETLEDVKTNVQSVVIPKRDKYIVWGDLGNYVTIVLSFLLLMRTPFDLQGPCTPGPCDVPPGLDIGTLDPCYVCDGFCISNPTKEKTNSHMLSLYTDLLFTLPLLKLRETGDLGKLGLDDFFLSSIKVYSVAGHGIAHWALSYLTRKGISVSNDNVLRNSVAFLLFLARFVNSGSVRQLQNVVDKFEGKRINPEEERRLMVANRNSNTLRARVAPCLAGILLALLTDAPPVTQPTLTNYVVFGLTCFVFFEAGIPPAANNWIFSILFSGITAWVAVELLGVSSIQHSFTIVFTSAYLVSAIYQLFVWDKATKRANPYAYSVSVWGSSVLTTCVGWLLALKCTDMKDIGGHVWYDFSISASYFLIYYFVNERYETKKGNIAY